MICCICHQPIGTMARDAWPLMDGLCCESCYFLFDLKKRQLEVEKQAEGETQGKETL